MIFRTIDDELRTAQLLAEQAAWVREEWRQHGRFWRSRSIAPVNLKRSAAAKRLTRGRQYYRGGGDGPRATGPFNSRCRRRPHSRRPRSAASPAALTLSGAPATLITRLLLCNASEHGLGRTIDVRLWLLSSP
jgi:hypothetical protein